MTEDRADGEQTRFTVRTTAEAHFAWLRTRLALERTIMAWVRTAVSLIGFGFAIVQFFDRLQQMPGDVAARFRMRRDMLGPRPDRLRGGGAGDLDLGVPLDGPLPVEPGPSPQSPAWCQEGNADADASRSRCFSR